MLKSKKQIELEAEVHRDTEEIMALVRRLKADSKSITDETISAISEITGTAPELVRVTVARSEGVAPRSISEFARGGLVTVDPKAKRLVSAVWIGLLIGILHAMGGTFGDRSSFYSTGIMLATLGALYNSVSTSQRKDALLTGFGTGVSYLISHSIMLAILGLFSLIWRVPSGLSAPAAIAVLVVSTFLGFLLHTPWRSLSKKWGLRSDRDERLDLLKQMVDIQDKLRAKEQKAAFLSLDLIGSTKMKQGADPLAVEFTFSEYHRFVESITSRNGGQLHSTAGDGVVCVFENSAMAFRAARQIQSGFFEFNTMRNRLVQPLQLRAGIDYGSIVPQGEGAKETDFSGVIDFACHIQKECPAGAVAISPSAIAEMSADDAILATDSIEVDGEACRVWRPASRIAELKPGISTPSLPGRESTP